MRQKDEGSGSFSDVVPSLVHILKTRTRRDQFRALDAIRAIGPDAKPAVPVLIEFLDVQHKLQDSAASALAAIGPDARDAVEPLSRIMLRKCPTWDYAHYSAALALGEIQDESAIPALIEAAQEPGDQVANWRAMDALGKFGPKAVDAVPALMGLLLQPHFDDMQGNILNALSNIGPANGIGTIAILEWIEAHPKDESRVSKVMNLYHSLFSGGPPHPRVAPTFIRLLKDDESEVVYWSALALGHLEDPRAISALIEVALSATELNARVEAIRSIGLIGIGSEEVLNALASSLADPHESIRCIAAFALGWLGKPAQKLLPLLRAAFASEKLKAAWLNEQEVIRKIEGES
jgi:HEAT repeat protein